MTFLDFMTICASITDAMQLDTGGDNGRDCARFNTFFEIESVDDLNTSNFGLSRKYWDKPYLFSRAWKESGSSSNDISHRYPTASVFRIGPDHFDTRKCEWVHRIMFMFADRRPDESKSSQDYCMSRTHTQAMKDLHDKVIAFFKELETFIYVLPVIAGSPATERWVSKSYADEQEESGAWDQYTVSDRIASKVFLKGGPQKDTAKTEAHHKAFADDLLLITLDYVEVRCDSNPTPVFKYDTLYNIRGPQ